MTDVDLDSFPLEHRHRYAYASELLKDKRVLDLAAREGYGTRIIAETARLVIGLDVDETVVQAAAARFQCDNLRFLVGSGVSIPLAEKQRFDGVVCFDAIDDSTRQQALFAEIKRVLAPDGLVIVSVPNAASKDNIFRVKAFASEELYQALQPHFSHVQLLHQTLVANSFIEPEATNGNGAGHNTTAPQYLLAIASNSTSLKIHPSTYADGLTTLMRKKETALRALVDTRTFQDETIKRQQRQLSGQKQTLATLEEAFAWHTSRIASLEKTRDYLQGEIDQLRSSLESQQKALDWRQAQVEDLEKAIATQNEALVWRATQLADLKSEMEAQTEALRQEMESRLEEQHRALTSQIDLATKALDATHASAGWQFILRVRAMRNALIPEGSFRYRVYNALAQRIRGK